MLLLPDRDAALLRERLAPPAARLVACLCAAWCRTCADYREPFAALAARHAGDCFVWIDIEDHADLVGDEDIDNFPTLLVQDGARVHFYGTMLPRIEVLERQLVQPPGSPVAGPDLRAALLAV